MCQLHDALDDALPGDFLGDIGYQHDPAKAERLAQSPPPPVNQFVENCRKCHGSGQFRGYSGRVIGPCHACKGKGAMIFKTSPEQREAARESAAQRKQRTVSEWNEANPIEAEWLARNMGRFDFATSLQGALLKYGSLTDGQMAAVRRCVLRDQERKAAHAQREQSAVAVDVGRIETALTNARANKVRWPKLRLDTFIFSLASETSRNPGAVYVKDKKTDAYLGKVMEGRFTRSSDCTGEHEARIIAAASDPEAAAKAYGQRFGACSICGRELTVSESIDRAMGPICASRFGWE